MAYEELSKNVKNFEVVLINLLPISSDKCEDALWKTFEAMPWLAIPFKDTDCSKKLLRIFEDVICDHGLDLVSKLVIIGPHGKFIEPFGAHIMMRYGIPAYPFTRLSAVNLVIKRAKDVKPEMLWNLDSVFRQQNGSQVRFSRIVGKRIIVLFQDYHGCTSEHTLNKLKALYIQMKGTYDEFEVIQIHEVGKFECVAAGVPWLMHPPFDRTSDAGQVIARFFGSICLGLVAFDCDGTVVRMTSSPAIGSMVFPFYECDGMDEIL